MKILLLGTKDVYTQSVFDSIYTISTRACLQYVKYVGNDGLSNVNLYFKAYQSSGSTVNVSWCYRCVKISSNPRVYR
jgi:ribonucleotide reductase beta subunit family protein with ferritin-like domain